MVYFLDVCTSVGLVLSFWDIIWISKMRISHYFDTSRVWVVDGIFVSDTHWVYIPCMNPHTWENRPSINMV